jgi:hypothetical protein
MKYAVLVVCFASLAHASDWVEVGKNTDGDRVFIDRSRIQMNADVAAVWQKEVLNSGGTLILHVAFRRGERKSQILSSEVDWADGTVTHTDGSNSWDDFLPNSLGQIVYDAVFTHGPGKAENSRDAFAAHPPPTPTGTPTWNGLAFGMTKDQVRAALKDRNLTITEKGESGLSVSGDMGPATGTGDLDFKNNRLAVITLGFGQRAGGTGAEQADQALRACDAEVSMVGETEALHRAMTVKVISNKYSERYGRPYYTDGDRRFPGASDDDSWWERDLLSGRAWTYVLSRKWRESGQVIKFFGSLLCRSGHIIVEYSPEDHSY